MTNPIVIKGITQDDLLALDAKHDQKIIEIEEGRVIIGEHTMTYLHHKIIENLYDLLKTYAKLHNLGYVHSDRFRYILSQTGIDIDFAYVPDLSFIKTERFPKNFDFMGDFIGAPNLAVEVISRGQSYAHQLSKIGRYFRSWFR